MCGIFGYVSNATKVPLGRLLEVGIATERARGGDAFGFAWLDAGERMRHYKQAGRLEDNQHVIDMLDGAKAVIGHARLATHGSVRDNCNNHPHPADGGWLIHNGIIPWHDQIARRHGLHRNTDCDSEVLALLAEIAEGTYIDRVAYAMSECEADAAVAAIWKGRNVVLGRTGGKPLSATKIRRALWFASEARHLPGRQGVSLPDNTVMDWEEVMSECVRGCGVEGGALGTRGFQAECERAEDFAR